MNRASLAELPFWPRYLSRDEAARYLGVSVDVFDDEVRAGLWPEGIARGKRGGRLTWDRSVLDRTADGRAGLLSTASPLPGHIPVDPGVEAWERRLSGADRRPVGRG